MVLMPNAALGVAAMAGLGARPDSRMPKATTDNAYIDDIAHPPARTNSRWDSHGPLIQKA